MARDLFSLIAVAASLLFGGILWAAERPERIADSTQTAAELPLFRRSLNAVMYQTARHIWVLTPSTHSPIYEADGEIISYAYEPRQGLLAVGVFLPRFPRSEEEEDAPEKGVRLDLLDLTTGEREAIHAQDSGSGESSYSIGEISFLGKGKHLKREDGYWEGSDTAYYDIAQKKWSSSAPPETTQAPKKGWVYEPAIENIFVGYGDGPEPVYRDEHRGGRLANYSFVP